MNSKVKEVQEKKDGPDPKRDPRFMAEFDRRLAETRLDPNADVARGN